MKEAGLNVQALNTAIEQVRGGAAVDSADGESQREALKSTPLTSLNVPAWASWTLSLVAMTKFVVPFKILQRRTKNNPVLIGEPGVGKTAIVEGWPNVSSMARVPDTLKNKRVLVLDMALLLAGAKYRASLKERLKAVLKDVAADEGQTIVFIDEIHTMVGAGKAEGAIDAGNMLKPATGPRRIALYWRTTLDEYRKYIEKDAALERRFSESAGG